MFKEMMEQIEEFLENTPKDIYEFSIILEDMLVDDYDETAEQGMKPAEIEAFKSQLEKEYQRAKQAMR